MDDRDPKDPVDHKPVALCQSLLSVLGTEALPLKGLETPLNASATAGCQEQNSSPMVIGTNFEVGRSGLEVAGLINTAERILSALFSTGSKNGEDLYARADGAGRRSARRIRGCVTGLQDKRQA